MGSSTSSLMDGEAAEEEERGWESAFYLPMHAVILVRDHGTPMEEVPVLLVSLKITLRSGMPHTFRTEATQL